MSNLTLAREGTAFFGDGVKLSWPRGGRRPVVPQPDGELSLRIRQRIAEQYIVVTDDEPNRPAWIAPASRIAGRASDMKSRREQRQAPGEAVVGPEISEVPVIVHEQSNDEGGVTVTVTEAPAAEVEAQPERSQRAAPRRSPKRRSRTTRRRS